jgi:hypothetical protein
MWLRTFRVEGDVMRRIAVCIALAALCACTTHPAPKPPVAAPPAEAPAVQPPPPPPPPPPSGPVLADWRALIRPSELGRLERLNEAWTQALNEARITGHADEVAALGDLANPQAGKTQVAPPPGIYRCRTVKLGAKAYGMLAFTAYDWFKCRIQATPKGLKLAKVSGSQRPSGLLFPDTDRRMIMLGSVSLGEEPAANSYGLHPERDFVGVLERLDGRRWRLAMPWPYQESNLDLIELERVS